LVLSSVQGNGSGLGHNVKPSFSFGTVSMCDAGLFKEVFSEPHRPRIMNVIQVIDRTHTFITQNEERLSHMVLQEQANLKRLRTKSPSEITIKFFR